MAGAELFPLWSFREDVFIESEPDGDTIVRSHSEDTTLRRLRPSVLAAMRRMCLGPVSLRNAITDSADSAALDAVLNRLHHLVVRSFGQDPARPLVSVVPLTPQARLQVPETPLRDPVRLSRFAVVRTDGRNFLVESPLSLHRVVLHGAAAMAALGALSRPAVPEQSDAVAQTLAAYLLATGIAVQATGGDPFQPVEFAEDIDPALVAWSPNDLLFHTRSTLGRHDQDFGATYPMGEYWSGEPVVKPATGHEVVALPRPGWDDAISVDPPLIAVMEASANERRYAATPVTAAELGELLYRTARVRSLAGAADELPADSPIATSDRPYSNTGRCYELELYVTVNRCAGVPRGVYHYDPLRHRLEAVTTSPADVDELLGFSRIAANLDIAPPVLIGVTARFSRVSWRYSGLAYSLVLRNAGALMQSMSLVCTAMRLASCRLDVADLEASSRILDLDWRVESSVGSLVIGHRAGDSPEPTGGGLQPCGANGADWPALARTRLG